MPDFEPIPRRRLKRILRAGIGLALLALASMALGQSDTNAPGASIQASPRAEIEQEMSALESARAPDDALTARALDLYQEALAAWQRVDERGAARAVHDALIASGRQQINETLQRAAVVEAQAERPVDLPGKRDTQTLLPLVEQARADTATLRSRLNERRRQVSAQDNRRRAIRDELAHENATLAALEDELASVTADTSLAPELRKATLASIRARQAASRAAIAALEKELLSQPIRADLLRAQRRELSARVRRSQARLEALESLLTAAQRAEALAAIADAGVDIPPEAADDPAVVQLRQANAETARLITRLTERIEETQAARQRTVEEGDKIGETFGQARRQLELADSSQLLGQILQQERRSLPEVSDYSVRVAVREAEIREASLRSLKLERELVHIEEPDRYVTEVVALSEDANPVVRETVAKLVRARSRLLDQAEQANQQYLQYLSDLAFEEEKVYRTAEEFDAFLAKRLLWLRTRGVLDLAALRQLVDEIRVLLDTQWWVQAGSGVARAVWHPLGVLTTLALLWLLAQRRALLRALRQTAEGIGKPSVDTFRQTLRALGITIVLALPLPAFLALVGHRMTTPLVGEDAVVRLGTGLVTVAPLVFFVSLLRALCEPNGLGVAHFRWNEHAAGPLRRQLDLLLLTFVLPAFLLVLTATRAADLVYGEITRALLLALLVGLAMFLYRLLHPTRGIVPALQSRAIGQQYGRRGWIWLGLGVLIPLALAGAVIYGYVYSISELLAGLINTLWLLVGLAILQEVIYRGLVVARRRLQLRQILARRQAQEEAEQVAEELEGAKPATDTEVNVQALDADTRQLVRIGMVLAGAAGVLLIWSDTLPALSVLQDITVWHTTAGSGDGETVRAIALADLLLSLLLAFLTVVGARTVPSVVEIMLRQRADIEPGTRLAFATLIRYAIVVVGALAALNLLGASWSKLQWLVAAVGVGIGFGLQEIVANFISGLIILIERPVRVGDVVTVGEVEGRVTRIQIRATTVTNWNSQEHLVPNKEFITGRVLNWSLSDQTTRLVIPVGVAYGTDAQQALDLLLEAAQEHPKVLKEPAPFVGFYAFSDSALALELRCFVGHIGDRLTTLNDLHMAIDRKYRAAGIQIAFPQRDLHLDSLRPLEVTLRHERREPPVPAQPTSTEGV